MLYLDSSLKERLENALKFAFNIGKQDELLALLYRLGEGWYNNGKQYVCFLHFDMAPHSFGFACFDLKDCEITKDGNETIITRKYGSEAWMVGGLIYHGPLEDGSEAENFTVQLIPKRGWSINT